MKFSMKKITVIALSIALIPLCACAVGKKKTAASTSTPAPDFSLTLSDGTDVKLSDYRGKAVLLHFWATWCPPCRLELPGMNSLAKDIAAKGDEAKLSFLAVCISDTEQNRASFMEENGYTFPGGLDESGRSAGLYGVTGIPTSVLISPEGTVEKINVGMMTEAQLKEFVSAYTK